MQRHPIISWDKRKVDKAFQFCKTNQNQMQTSMYQEAAHSRAVLKTLKNRTVKGDHVDKLILENDAVLFYRMTITLTCTLDVAKLKPSGVNP